MPKKLLVLFVLLVTFTACSANTPEPVAPIAAEESEGLFFNDIEFLKVYDNEYGYSYQAPKDWEIIESNNELDEFYLNHNNPQSEFELIAFGAFGLNSDEGLNTASETLRQSIDTNPYLNFIDSRELDFLENGLLLTFSTSSEEVEGFSYLTVKDDKAYHFDFYYEKDNPKNIYETYFYVIGSLEFNE